MMNKFKALIPSTSALVHMRFAFSFFLMPVYFFALSQAPGINTTYAILVFISWHLFIYPASNGYNSYFDKDEGSIALVEKPPQVDISLYCSALLFEFIGVFIGFVVGWQFGIATFIYGVLSKAYSHPTIRLKKFPIASFVTVFIFQGAFVYWSTFMAVSGMKLSDVGNVDFFITGVICSCLIGASYPLTQVYQHEEDQKRGDTTLSILLGIRGSFIFSALLFGIGTFLMFLYWTQAGQLQNFWLFLLFAAPVFALFLSWFLKVLRDEKQANFKNMMLMTSVSGAAMLIYFIILCLKK